MNLSLNEVEALARKAARGAGYPWGLAEEAARATRWLCAHDVDGCRELAGLLAASDGADLRDRAPVPGNAWAARGGRLCPIATGAALSDRAGSLGEAGLRFENVVHPVMLVPFAGQCARQRGTVIALSWEGVVATTDGTGLCLAGATAATVASVTLTTGAELGHRRSRRSRASPDPSCYRDLHAFACRTYAPATDESRLKGAGAGLRDAD